MSSTQFQTRPTAVAQLTTSEFIYNLEWNNSPSFDGVLRRFGNEGIGRPPG